MALVGRSMSILKVLFNLADSEVMTLAQVNECATAIRTQLCHSWYLLIQDLPYP
jgi:hypothetical protein